MDKAKKTSGWLRLCATTGLAIPLLLILSGCSEIEARLGKELKPTPPDVVVEKLPPGYDPGSPRPPYLGPHASLVPLDLSGFGFPVLPGEVGPIDDSLGPLQYPFTCNTEEVDLGQPLVDNQDGIGTPVYAVVNGAKDKTQLLGHSRDCLLQTRVGYYYKVVESDHFRPLPAGELPTDIDWLELNGKRLPFVVRVEQGTINRFIYAIAMLADPDDPVESTTSPYWNRKLIYHFKGGVGIGKRQGKMSLGHLTSRRVGELAKGYALIGSSGNVTSNHYNMWLAANTAEMVKAQFVARYGRPDYTVGIGGSGGAVQQYLIAQNKPGLLDALIPLYSYPDMITQSIWALDCELLEYYFDVTARDNKRWQVQENRGLVMGVAASSEVEHQFKKYYRWARYAGLGQRLPKLAPGATECSKSWRGLAPLTNNPHYSHRALHYAPKVAKVARFSHWHDAAHIYGVGEDGFANRTHDNVGVQYGLDALKKGSMSIPEFLHLNANIGSWKPPADMTQERLWVLTGDDNLSRVSIWSDHNMQKTPGGAVPLQIFERNQHKLVRVAPRSQGHPGAMAAAYHGGHVFLGNIDIPIIDLRHYLDPELDMHHSYATLSSWLRIRQARGNTDNMLIWQSEKPFDPSDKAFALLDEWLTTGQRPAAAQDACWTIDGELIAEGPDVWSGPWRGEQQLGTCLKRFPPYRSPRNVSGSPLGGDLFKCALMPVAQALSRGTYGDIDMSPYQAMLETIFPDGVCDYSLGDTARPTDSELGLSTML
ncbi:DUF6351 family protein [Zobellella aerophila]|uniref:DUF6351 domain-containing protein n=1 Tax=Zobellella aerophila TaxID=870480 RepID=A0ABP6W3S8_9GAMM